MDYITAFISGILTFLSPCVLPLIPGYLSMVSGISASEIINGEDKNLHKKVFLSGIFFFLGFSLVFTILGASASSIGFLFREYKEIFQKVMGILLIILGFHITGLINFKFLNYEKRNIKKFKNKNYLTAFLIGIGFAFGWTPCIGPILAGILMLASTKEVLKGTILLFLYSFGLGLPFLISGFFSVSFFKFISKYKTAFNYVEIISGVILIFLGILLFLNRFSF